MAGPLPNDILKRISLTEKTSWLAEARNIYTFEVPIEASKPEIKQAVESAYEVRVIGVNTMTRASRKRRFRTRITHSQPRKRALVELHPDDRIALY